MEIISVFQQGEKIDLCYTAEGENLSPPLQFKGVSSEAKSLVLIMDDPDAPQQTFVHWVVWDIAPSLKEMSAGAKELDQMKVGKGLNDAGTTDYFGPKPPAGPAHAQVSACARGRRPLTCTCRTQSHGSVCTHSGTSRNHWKSLCFLTSRHCAESCGRGCFLVPSLNPPMQPAVPSGRDSRLHERRANKAWDKRIKIP